MESIRNLKVMGFPLGDFVLERSRFSGDTRTQEGVRQIRESATNGGVLVLDRHVGRYGIAVLSAQVSEFPEVGSMYGPSAGYLDLFGPYVTFRTAVNNMDGFEIMRVWRTDERGKSGKFRLVPWIAGRVFTEDMAKENREFTERMKHTVSVPGEVGVVAPFGTRVKEGEGNVRRGVVEALRTGVPAICADTIFNGLDCTIHLSPNVLRFDPEASREEMSWAVNREFGDVRRQWSG